MEKDKNNSRDIEIRGKSLEIKKSLWNKEAGVTAKTPDNLGSKREVEHQVKVSDYSITFHNGRCVPQLYKDILNERMLQL